MLSGGTPIPIPIPTEAADEFAVRRTSNDDPFDWFISKQIGYQKSYSNV